MSARLCPAPEPAGHMVSKAPANPWSEWLARAARRHGEAQGRVLGSEAHALSCWLAAQRRCQPEGSSAARGSSGPGLHLQLLSSAPCPGNEHLQLCPRDSGVLSLRHGHHGLLSDGSRLVPVCGQVGGRACSLEPCCTASQQCSDGAHPSLGRGEA